MRDFQTGHRVRRRKRVLEMRTRTSRGRGGVPVVGRRVPSEAELLVGGGRGSLKLRWRRSGIAASITVGTRKLQRSKARTSGVETRRKRSLWRRDVVVNRDTASETVSARRRGRRRRRAAAMSVGEISVMLGSCMGRKTRTVRTRTMVLQRIHHHTLREVVRTKGGHAKDAWRR